MKNLQWIVVVVLILVLAAIVYCPLQGAGAEPVLEDLGENSVEEFDYAYMADKEQMILDCQFPNPTVKTEKGKSQMFIEGLENSMGGYQLPIRNFVLALPQDTDVSSVTIERNKAKKIENIVLKKVRLGTIKEVSNDKKTTDEVEEINYSVQEKEGCKFVIFSISPVEYIEAKKKVNFYPNITATVHLEEREWKVEQVTLEAIKYLKEMVDNPEMIDTYDVEIAMIGDR